MPARHARRRLDAVPIVAAAGTALWFDVFPWLSLHVPVDGSAINGRPVGA
jgi:hypothetical protein